ncbi:MAG: hypothetical protein AABZ55_12955 [Bdellovibrionota bacterium]
MNSLINKRLTVKTRQLFFTVALASLVALSSFAAEAKKPTKAIDTPENRQKMADIHQNMATCLRSDKPMMECKKDMQKNCSEMMGKEGCPMMSGLMGGMMGKGMMGKGMMESDKE